MIPINDSVIRRAAIVLRALHNKRRTQILRVLDKFGEMTLQELKEYLDGSASNNSLINHLAFLRKAMLVTYSPRRVGRHRVFVYKVDRDRLTRAVNAAMSLGIVNS
jgi:DNA-binding transcriptional ArsR family regulator